MALFDLTRRVGDRPVLRAWPRAAIPATARRAARQIEYGGAHRPGPGRPVAVRVFRR